MRIGKKTTKQCTVTAGQRVRQWRLDIGRSHSSCKQTGGSADGTDLQVQCLSNYELPQTLLFPMITATSPSSSWLIEDRIGPEVTLLLYQGLGGSPGRV